MNKNKLEPRPSATSDHEYMDMRESPAPNEESVRDPNRPQSTVSDEYIEINDEAEYRVKPNRVLTSIENIKQPARTQQVVQFQENSAYNVTSRQDESRQGRENITNMFYDEIPVTLVPETNQGSQANDVDVEDKRKSHKIILPGEALCSFWQGKVEIVIRIANLAVRNTYNYITYT